MRSHNHRWFLTNQFQILFNHWQHCCYGQATISHLGATWTSLHTSFDHFSDHLMIVSGLFIPALKLIPLFWSLLRSSSGRLRPSAGRRHCAARCFRRWTWPRWARSRAGSGCTCSRSSNARGWNRVPPASGLGDGEAQRKPTRILLKKKENYFTWPTSILCTPGPPPAMATVIPTGAPPEERCYKYFFNCFSTFVKICEKTSILVHIGPYWWMRMM